MEGHAEMTSRTIMLNRIKEYCFMHCKYYAYCHDNGNQTCPLYPFKDGKVPDQYKRKMTKSQLENLRKSPRNGKALQGKALQEKIDAEETIENNV